MQQNTEESTSEPSHVQKPNYVHTLVAAGISGGCGAYASFFFEGAKKRLQSNQKLPNLKNIGPYIWLKESFRGSSGFAGSLIPTSIIQQMTSHYFEEKKLSYTLMGRTIEIVCSGGLGGIFSTMVENLVLEQQMTKTGPKDAFFNLLKQGNTRIFRGLPLVMSREAIFGFCYLKGADEASNYAATNFVAYYAIPAQLAVGAIGSLISHPFDTTATTMQRYGFNSMLTSAKHLWNENKVKSFYKGGAMRIGLFTTAMLTIKNTQEITMRALEDEHQPINAKAH